MTKTKTYKMKTYKTLKAYLKANHSYDDLQIAKFIIENGINALCITPTKTVKMDEKGQIIMCKITDKEVLAYLTNQ